MADYTRNRKLGWKNLPQQSHQRQVLLGFFTTKLQKNKLNLSDNGKLLQALISTAQKLAAGNLIAGIKTTTTNFSFLLSQFLPLFSLWRKSWRRENNMFLNKKLPELSASTPVSLQQVTQRRTDYIPFGATTSQESLQEGKAQVSQFYATICSKVATEIVRLF